MTQVEVATKAQMRGIQVSLLETGSNVEIQYYERVARVLKYRNSLEMFTSGGDAATRRLLRLWRALPDDEARTDALSQVLSASALLLEADNVHLGALVTGESYVIVWPDVDTGIPEVYYNDSRNVHLFYEASRPKVKRFAVKWWLGDDAFRLQRA